METQQLAVGFAFYHAGTLRKEARMAAKIKKEVIESAGIVEKTTMEIEEGWAEGEPGFESDLEDFIDMGGFESAEAFPESPEPVKKGKKNKELGRRGEDVAQHFLEKMGYEILDRNWTCVMGEADIVALQDDTLVFVEVKTRRNLSKGMPEEAVSPAKRRKYECIAAMYLKEYEDCDSRVRFDVIGIMVLDEGRYFIKHHINAFGAE